MLRSISSVKMRGGVLVVVMTAASVFMSEAAVAAPKASEQERQERQTRYRDLDGKEAKALAEREFPGKFKERQWRNVLERADRVREYVGDAAAVVELPGRDRPALVQSTLPLRARDEAGAMSDLDTGLVARAGGLEARNALIDARFGQSVGQGVQLEGGIGVRFAGVAGEAEAQVDGDKAFYAATMPATDQTLVATPDGLEVLWQLRGRDAPEQFGLDFTLPPGAKLRLVREADRPVRVEVSRGKEVLLEIRPPAAWDAEQQPIPVDYEVAAAA